MLNPPLVSKILTQLAYPLNLSLFFSLLAGLLFWRGRKHPAGLCLLFSLLVLGVPSLPAVSDSLRASLERRHRPMALEEVPKADAILVLGGAVRVALPPRLMWCWVPQVARGAPLSGAGLGDQTAFHQQGDLQCIELVVLGLISMNSSHVQRMPQHKGKRFPTAYLWADFCLPARIQLGPKRRRCP